MASNGRCSCGAYTESSSGLCGACIQRSVTLYSSSAAPRSNRAETGAMQFGDDWPGVFIRGDNAMAFGMWLEVVIANSTADPLTILQLRGLVSVLNGCDARGNPQAQLLRPFDEAQVGGGP